VVVETTSFPDRPEAITAEWLTEAFSSSWPGIRVKRVEVLDQHSGTTGRMRARLEYEPGPQGPETVFVKLPPFDEGQRQLVAMTDMGRREARFYAGPAAEVPIRHPGAYYAAYGSDPQQYVMVLEDLEASGCTFAAKGLDAHAEENGEQFVGSLARLHAHFWNDPRLDTEFSWVPRPARSALSVELVEKARAQFGAEFPPVFTELADLWIESQDRIVDLWEEGAPTLIHGDVHNGNHFMDDKTVGLYDWAVVNRAPGIRDVSIYLGHSCPTELRRREQDRWMRTYHQGLVDAGVDAPSLDELWLGYRRGVMYAWISATTTAVFGSLMQPIEVSMRAIGLANATCADLETVEALREGL
jgi:hypothetical protein